MYQVIIFDFDGTIADSLGSIRSLFNEIADKYNLPQIKDKDLNELRGMSVREIVKKFKISSYKLLRITLEIQPKFKSIIRDVEVIDGIPDLIKNLHKSGKQIGIVSSNSTENIELFLTHNKIKDVDFIHTEKNLFGKGSVLKHTLSEQKIDKSKAFYVGDEVRDIEAARKAGIPVISVTWGFNNSKRLKKAKPDFMVDKPLEIEKLIKELG